MTHFMRTLSVLAIAFASSAVALADAEPVGELRVYHVGDLPLFDEERFESPVDVAVFIAEEFYGMSAQPLGPGLIALQEDDEGHATFVQAMNALRAAEGEPMGIRIAVRHLSRGELDEVRAGMPLPENAGELALRHEQVIHLGLPTMIESATGRAYVNDLNPIVGTDSIAHDPLVAQLETGVILTVHAGDHANGGATLRMSGAFSRVFLDEHITTGVAGSAVEAPMQLPIIDRRSISSVITAPENVEIVFAVVHFPEEDETLALTATVWSVD